MYNIVIRKTTLWWYDDEADITWWTSLMTVFVWCVCFYWCNPDVNRGICLRELLVPGILMFKIVIRTTTLWWYDDEADITWWTSLMTVPVWCVCLYWCNTDVNWGICLRVYWVLFISQRLLRIQIFAPIFFGLKLLDFVPRSF